MLPTCCGGSGSRFNGKDCFNCNSIPPPYFKLPLASNLCGNFNESVLPGEKGLISRFFFALTHFVQCFQYAQYSVINWWYSKKSSFQNREINILRKNHGCSLFQYILLPILLMNDLTTFICQPPFMSKTFQTLYRIQSGKIEKYSIQKIHSNNQM